MFGQLHQYNDRDQKSHIFKCSSENNHQYIHINNSNIIGKVYKTNFFKRKVSEVLQIREIKPSLNDQEKSIELKLFN